MSPRTVRTTTVASENRYPNTRVGGASTGAGASSGAPISASWSDDLERIADALHRSAAGKSGASFFRSHVPRAWEPKVNVYETAGAFLLCLELAGMSTAEIDVTLDGETLVVSGTRGKPSIPGSAESSAQRVSIPVMEIDTGPFERRIRLSRHIAKEGIEATYKNGFLWITLPKRDSGEATS